MPADQQDLRRKLAVLAARQSGHFTAAQALDVGYSYQSQKYHTDRGNWIRVDRGLYRLPEWPVGEHDDLVRWSLWSKGRAVVSHETALTVHDLGDVNPARIHLTVPPGFRAEAHGAVLHHAAIPKSDIHEHEAFRVTTPIRTLLDVAAGDLELDQLKTAVTDACARNPAMRQALLVRADDFGDRAALRIERALRLGDLP